jgi:hypothetical protein
VTIATGVLAKDGVSLAADTEMSWDDQRLKTEGAKLAVEAGGLAVAGAGLDMNYIEAVMQEFQEAFSQERSNGIDRCEAAMAARLNDFYQRFVTPHNDPSLDVQMIVAAQLDSECRLWVTSKNLLRRVRDQYAAVGIGAPTALSILKRLLTDQTDAPLELERIATAELTNIYAVMLTKQHVQGCGNRTDVARIYKNIAKILTTHTADYKEYELSRFQGLHTRLAQFMLGALGNQENPDESAEHLRRYLIGTRHSLLQMWAAEGTGAQWTI